MTTCQTSLISAGSISLDSTFNSKALQMSESYLISKIYKNYIYILKNNYLQFSAFEEY